MPERIRSDNGIPIESVSPDSTIDELVRGLMGQDQRAFPVLQDGALLGIVCFEEVRRVRRLLP